jgi:hypothetical protein
MTLAVTSGEKRVSALGRVGEQVGGTRESSVVPPRRGVRWPEAAVGLALMVVAGLAGLAWHLSAVDRTPVVGVAGPVERGSVIETGDLTVLHVSGDQVEWVDASALESVVGQVAVVDLVPGMLVSDAVVTDPEEVISPSEAVVGVELPPGGYPATALRHGDVVNVVLQEVGAVPSSGVGDQVASHDADGDAEDGEGEGTDDVLEDVGTGAPVGEAASLVTSAEVVAVEEMSGGERLLVSLRTSVSNAERIAAVDPGRVRLIQVASP